MDEGVDQDKHPDRRRHEPDTSPHAHHSTSMVVRLQSRARLALGQDDEGVEDLVELAQVKDPAVVRKTLVPDTSRLSVGGQTVDHSTTVGGKAHPALRLIIEEDRVPNTPLTMKTTQEVSRPRAPLTRKGADPTPPHAAQHAPERPGRVHGEEDVVQDDKGEEGPRLAYPPGLLAVGLVVLVEQLDGDGIERGDGHRDPGVERAGEPIVGNVEGVHDA